MFCPQCGAQASDDARFCVACGTPIPTLSVPVEGASASAVPPKRVRPGVVTLLAVIKFLSAFVWLVLGLALFSSSGSSSDGYIPLSIGVVFLVLSGWALACGYGLWTLRPYGRYLQLAYSCLGLLGFPFQTIISILILLYMFKPGARILFSDTPVESLAPADQAQLRSLGTGNAAAIVIAIAVAIPIGIAIMGIMAAIAIPNLLNAIDRAKQKRTMADLHSIGVAIESYAADKNMYPAAGTAAELRAALEPTYIKAMPMVDGWGHAFQASSSNTEYALYSSGKDGVGDDCEAVATETYNDEICFADGRFVRYPQGLGAGH